MIEEIDYDIIHFYSTINFSVHYLWRFTLYLLFKLIVMLIIYPLYFPCEGGGALEKNILYCNILIK